MDTPCHDALDAPVIAHAEVTPPRRRGDNAAAPAGWTLGPGPVAVDAWTLMRVLDEIDYGLMLVDDDALVRYANRVALQECGASRGLHLDEGRVSPRTAQDHAPFHRALASSTQGRRSLLSVAAGDATLSLAVVPLTGAPLSTARTLLVMGKREACPPLSVDFFARAHQLTAAEAAVLRGLCNGLRPVEIAAGGGVAISTVRTQIGAIRSKTGTTGIRELVGRVAALPPIASLPHKLGWDTHPAGS